MFKKFNFRDDVAGQSQVKTSVQRSIRAKILAQYPLLGPIIDDLLPKKTPMVLVKWSTNTSTSSLSTTRSSSSSTLMGLSFQVYGWFTNVQVDRGAIKFVLSGAMIMCPGLTSKGARMNVELPAESVVAVMAEGKEHAMAVGLTKMSTEDIRKVNKGSGVDNMHHLNDPLWKETAIQS
ncbi:PUA domain-containing protein [Endogone sp. FLAS-F59071]|nr:PUA domain-containing protein [Endogone sp. FLAS-F59071]|eukprot:RUS14384.1 PUA domain-containing protein [Endogone sp. FLAS-F59071]